ncbi:MAG: ArsR/SmtB family transcription factor [Bacteroidota bacterium]
MSVRTPRKGALTEREIDSFRRELSVDARLDALSSLLNAAGNETRIRILYLLWRNGEVRVNDLAEILNVSTPAISQQLKKLRRHRLVTSRREAQTVFYGLYGDAPFVLRLIDFFERLDHPSRPPFRRPRRGTDA